MSDIVNIILNGCNGNLGRTICRLANAENAADVVAGVDINPPPVAFPVFMNIHDCQIPADVIIDASTAKAVRDTLRYALTRKIPLIVCTTAMDENTLEKLDAASREIPVFISANLALGVNLLYDIAAKIAPLLSSAGFDIEIIEKHHNQKTDAPSGTALVLAKTINEALGNKCEFMFDRSQKSKKRADSEIGIHSVRAGTIVGEHSVIFAGNDEVIELTHKAVSRDVFAAGAIRAAKFLAGKPAGRYGMNDLIGNVEK